MTIYLRNGMNTAGIILCGGHSRRMGAAKWALRFGSESLLERVARRLAEACSEIVVVGPASGELPDAPHGTLLVRDRITDRGPLAGLAAGLAAINPESVAFVTGCDVPNLQPAFVRRMFDLLDDHAAAVPITEGCVHPLAAVYRASLVDLIDELLARDRLGPKDLLNVVSTRRVEASELFDVDPTLASLQSVNTPEEYRAALAAAGL